MLTTIHGKAMVVDKWTGEAFDGSVKFKIPTFTKGGVKWVGCYGIPSTALSGLNAACDVAEPKMAVEKRDELFQKFQSSLENKDPKRVRFDIVAAQDFHDLKSFNPAGKTTTEEFHKTIGWDFQREAFRQVISPSEDDSKVEAAAGAGTKRSRPSGSKVKGTMIPAKKKEGVIEWPLGDVPRNFVAWNNFFGELSARAFGIKSAVVTTDSKHGVMMMSDPREWGKIANPRASGVMNGEPVFGKINVAISKGPLKGVTIPKDDVEEGPPKKKKTKKEEPVEEMDSDSDTDEEGDPNRRHPDEKADSIRRSLDEVDK
jgi:hypothetical protein